MKSPRVMDEWLKERLDRYDRWLDQGRIAYSSKVIPVNESLEGHPWILPTERVMEYLRNARSFAVADCACRTRYRRCEGPVEVCFFINDTSDKLVRDGSARRLSWEEASQRLKLANQHGLVHLTLYKPDEHPYAICSCCACCCHDLQYLLSFDRRDLVARSAYIAQGDVDACVQCGLCVERCVFGARFMEGDRLVYEPDRCYGCGLCVTICPSEAIRLVKKPAAASSKAAAGACTD